MSGAPLRVLFASGEPYPPSSFGGAERSTHELVRELLARGHACEVVAGLARGGPRRVHRAWSLLTGARRVARRDLRNGYPTHRAVPRRIVEALRERLGAFRPDLVVAWNRASEDVAREAEAARAPCLVWVHDATFSWHAAGLPPATRVAAVSGFLAARARERLGRPVAVLRPVLRLSDCRAAARRPEHVTFVGPRPEKGLDVAAEVAGRLPGRRFLFVGADGLSRSERAELDARLRGRRNVRVVGRARDMRAVYGATAVLLVPSRCEDAAPRVILEAHANGVPVVASDVGGIPEVSGGASVLLPPAAPAGVWAAEVERLLSDPAAAADLGARGRENAARPELGALAAVEAFLALARAAIAVRPVSA